MRLLFIVVYAVFYVRHMFTTAAPDILTRTLVSSLCARTEARSQSPTHSVFLGDKLHSFIAGYPMDTNKCTGS